MLKKLAILVAAASLATPALAAPAEARDNWLGQAQEINKTQIGKRDPGARRMLIKSGTTPANRTVSYPVRLEAGKFYGFMADCDYECNEAKLTLTQNGQEIESFSQAENSSPMFSLRANRTGEYKLNYTITDCEKDRCAYSVEVYKGNREYDMNF